MERNLNRRVEVMWPVHDSVLAPYLRDVLLDAHTRDNARATVLRQDGEYERVKRAKNTPVVDAQVLLQRALPPHGGTLEPVSPGAPGADVRAEESTEPQTEEAETS
jgi:hypothetical protein